MTPIQPGLLAVREAIPWKGPSLEGEASVRQQAGEDDQVNLRKTGTTLQNDLEPLPHFVLSGKKDPSRRGPRTTHFAEIEASDFGLSDVQFVDQHRSFLWIGANQKSSRFRRSR